MQIFYSNNFIKHFKQRIYPNPKLKTKFEKQVSLFLSDPKNPALKNHHLVGKMNHFSSFSITNDVRVIYQLLSPNKAEFLNIGTHNQVY